MNIGQIARNQQMLYQIASKKLDVSSAASQQGTQASQQMSSVTASRLSGYKGLFKGFGTADAENNYFSSPEALKGTARQIAKRLYDASFSTDGSDSAVDAVQGDFASTDSMISALQKQLGAKLQGNQQLYQLDPTLSGTFDELQALANKRLQSVNLSDSTTKKIQALALEDAIKSAGPQKGDKPAASDKVESADKTDMLDEKDKADLADLLDSIKTDTADKTEVTDKADTKDKTEVTDKAGTKDKTDATDKTDPKDKVDATDKTDATDKVDATDKTDGTGKTDSKSPFSRPDRMDTIQSELRKYPTGKRAAALDTMNKVWQNELDRIGEYIKQKDPNWSTWGDPFDTSILNSYQPGLNVWV